LAIETRETRKRSRAAGIHSQSHNMVQLKPSSAPPKPKYGYLSEIEPEFAPLREKTDKNFAVPWSLPMDGFKAVWLSAPVPLPEDAPQPGKDYLVSDRQVPVCDGTKVSVRLYKPIKPVNDAVLVLKAHGGGETHSVVPPNHGPFAVKHRLGCWRP
jgi:hypothetical protein